MSGLSPLEEALRRLNTALDHMESAVDERLEGQQQAADVESELHRLGTDRSKLAQSLDSAEARSARLEEANREVSRRLVAAMEQIRGVIDRSGMA